MPQRTKDLENILEQIEDVAQDKERSVTIGDVIDLFSERSFGALLTMIAVLACIPIISAIPGFSILTGTLVILVAAQQLAGRDAPWVPKRLREIEMGSETLRNAVETSKPYAARVDRLIKPRLSFLVEGAAARLAFGALSIVLALMFYPLALVPGGVTAPAIAIAALGLALVGRDGALALIGLAASAGSFVLLYWIAV